MAQSGSATTGEQKSKIIQPPSEENDFVFDENETNKLSYDELGFSLKSSTDGALAPDGSSSSKSAQEGSSKSKVKVASKSQKIDVRMDKLEAKLQKIRGYEDSDSDDWNINSESDDEKPEEGNLDDEIEQLLPPAPAPHPDDQNIDNILQPYISMEEVSDPINERWANVFNTMAQGKMKDDVLEERYKQYKRPKNIDIHIPRVNAEAWEAISKDTKNFDCNMQRIQKEMLCSINILSKVVDEHWHVPYMRAGIKQMCDAAGLILKANFDINMERRRMITEDPGFNHQYKGLKSPDIPVTKLLFGDDLKESCSKLDGKNKMKKSIKLSNKGKAPKSAFGKYRFNPYAKSSDNRSKNWGRYDQNQYGQNQFRQNQFNYRRGKTYSKQNTKTSNREKKM